MHVLHERTQKKMSPKKDETMTSTDELQAERHKAYDLAQRLTFFVIGLEVVVCGYILINARTFCTIPYIADFFFVTGLAAFCGIGWRFCYNETYSRRVYQQDRSIAYKIYYFCQGLMYWSYITLTAVFFVCALLIGYHYLTSIDPRLKFLP